jgi:hypothetical protein
MIKHTTQDHPDYGNLLLALGEIRTLADRMNKGEKEVNEAEIEADRLRDIEGSIEGITEVCKYSFKWSPCVKPYTLLNDMYVCLHVCKRSLVLM